MSEYSELVKRTPGLVLYWSGSDTDPGPTTPVVRGLMEQEGRDEMTETRIISVWENALRKEIEDLRDLLFARRPCKCDPPGSGEEYCTGHCELNAEIARLRKGLGEIADIGYKPIMNSEETFTRIFAIANASLAAAREGENGGE